MKNQGRKVEFKTFRRATKEEREATGKRKYEVKIKGVFHEWGSVVEYENESVAANTVGIIEVESGEIHTPDAWNVKFLDK